MYDSSTVATQTGTIFLGHPVVPTSGLVYLQAFLADQDLLEDLFLQACPEIKNTVLDNAI